jgi:hypothetical protein
MVAHQLACRGGKAPVGILSFGGARVGAGVEGFGQAVVQVEGRLKGNEAQLRDGWGLRGDGCQVATAAEVVFVTGFEQSEQPGGIHGRDGGQVDHEMGVVIASRPASASLNTDTVAGFIVPVTVHTVMSGRGFVSTAVMVGVPPGHDGVS